MSYLLRRVHLSQLSPRFLGFEIHLSPPLYAAFLHLLKRYLQRARFHSFCRCRLFSRQCRSHSQMHLPQMGSRRRPPSHCQPSPHLQALQFRHPFPWLGPIHIFTVPASVLALRQNQYGAHFCPTSPLAFSPLLPKPFLSRPDKKASSSYQYIAPIFIRILLSRFLSPPNYNSFLALKFLTSTLSCTVYVGISNNLSSG